MKNTELLKAIGGIDDKYVAEADGSNAKSKSGSVNKRRRFIKWAGGAVAALLVISIIGSGFGGMLQGTKSADPSAPEDSNGYMYESVQKPGAITQNDFSSNKYGKDGDRLDASGGTSYENKSDTSSVTSFTADASVKLVYRADITAQTMDFAEAVKGIKDTVASFGGYFESQSISNGTYYNGDFLKVGQYIIRIPAGKYTEFVNGIGEDLTVKSIKETVDDIGLSYAETEQKLESLNIKLDRLQELLSKAKDMSDIITLENEISDTEYQIDCYQGDLNKYNSLINYSTITLSLTEVARPGSGIEEKDNFFKELGRNFLNGLEETGSNVANIFYWVSYNIVELIILAVVIVLFVKFRPVTKLIRKIRNRE